MNTTAIKFGTERGHCQSHPRSVQVLELLRTWYTRARQRRQLAGLDRSQLKDVGISRADALTETAKPFWKA